jgi:hypothetical protein
MSLEKYKTAAIAPQGEQNKMENMFVMPEDNEIKDRTENGEWFVVPGLGIELRIRFIPAEEFTDIAKEYRVRYKNKRTGEYGFYTDEDKKISVSMAAIRNTVTDWKGVGDKSGNQIPFSKDVFRKFMNIMATTAVDEVDEDGDKQTLSGFIFKTATNSDLFFGQKKT